MKYRFGPSQTRTRSLALAVGVVLMDVGLLGFAVTTAGHEQVEIALLPHADPKAVRPLRVFAVYSPAGPGPDDRPENWVTQDGHINGNVNVPAESLDPEASLPLSIVVPGVPEADWHVQLVIEDPDY